MSRHHNVVVVVVVAAIVVAVGPVSKFFKSHRITPVIS